MKMKWNNKLLFVFSLILVCTLSISCKKQQIISPTISDNSGPLARNASAYVAVSQDGVYGDIIYHGSGQIVTGYIVNSLLKRIQSCSAANQHKNIDQNFIDARNNNCTYLVVPEILHWEDRNTAWSGRLDHVTVKISIYEVASQRTLHSTLIQANSPWLTLINYPPEVLLPEPIDEYVGSLF